MSAYVSPFKRFLLSNFPALPYGEAINPVLRALISVLADRDGMTLSDWLDKHIRAHLADIVPTSMRYDPVTRGQPYLDDVSIEHWGELSRDRIDTAPPIGLLEGAALALRPDIERVLALVPPSPLDRAKVPTRRRHRLFDGTLSTIAIDHDDDKRVWVERLKAFGHEREIQRVTPAMMHRVEQLLSDAPNMHEATLFVLGQLSLAQRDANQLSLPPLLLVGPPAAGKTWWAEELGKALGVRSELIAMGSVTASFELSGGSSSWSHARPGRILRKFLAGLTASPVFVLDEVEKISAGNYDPAPVLLHLIERATAARWRDEFYDMEFDVSRAIFIATANDPSRMDSALRSRFRKIIVRTPTRAEREPVIASVWRTLRRSRPKLRLAAELSVSVMSELVDQFIDARQTQRLMEEGLGRAARRSGALTLEPGDVGGSAAHLVFASPSVSHRSELPPSP